MIEDEKVKAMIVKGIEREVLAILRWPKESYRIVIDITAEKNEFIDKVGISVNEIPSKT
jgi:hypothetical protein